MSGHDSIIRLRDFTAANPFGKPKRQALTKRAKGTRKRRDNPEYRLHVEVVTLLRKHLPPQACVLHVPNARQGDDEAAARDRMHRDRMGVMKGAPDLLVIFEGRVVGVELKASAGNLSTAQQFAHSLLQGCGMPTTTARSIEDVVAFLARHGIQLTHGLSEKLKAPTKKAQP